MKDDGKIFAWGVLVESNPPGKRWKPFKTRADARAYRKACHGKLFAVVRSH